MLTTPERCLSSGLTADTKSSGNLRPADAGLSKSVDLPLDRTLELPATLDEAAQDVNRRSRAWLRRRGFREGRCELSCLATATAVTLAFAAVTVPTPRSRNDAFQLRTAAEVIRLIAVAPNVG
jgi:hypothetical protein